MRREEQEWTSTWWEQANDTTLPRVLLIGDSITRDYHPFVQSALLGVAQVDLFATSRFAADPFFGRELALYLAEYPYAAIHLNHGLHGKEFSQAAYAAAYEMLLQQVMSACPHVVLATSTPAALPQEHTALETAYTKMVRQRNRVVSAFAEQYRISLNDLFSLAQAHPEWKLPDAIHFTAHGSENLARQVATALGTPAKTKSGHTHE